MPNFKSWAIALLAVGLSPLATAGETPDDHPPALVAPSEPLTADEQQKRFHLPTGFEIQLVAAEPEIRKPINLQFDARGRLWATQSTEYPFPANEGQGNDAVKIFEQFGGDGRAARVTVFAEGLNIPIGLLPLSDGALVYSIPNLWYFRDADGDDRADSREPLFGPIGYGDTHGMCSSLRRWLDGWVYGCHGFANTSTLRGSDGHEITMHSGNTYRLRLDGTRIEYFTHGQVNPFGLAFDPEGNLFSADCHTLPLYLLLRGAYYPSFGKPHDGLGFGPAVLSHLHGSTGIAGVAVYAADHFPAEYHGTAFIGNPVTGRVNHDRLEPRGSSFAAIEQPDFIRCDDPWFRPVDVRLGPDGALYIADFYNCIIGHYEVPLTDPRRDRQLGRIWRVVYKGPRAAALPPQMPDLTRVQLSELIATLADANLERRLLATHELVDRFGSAAVEPAGELLAADAPDQQRVCAMWILERLAALDDARMAGLLVDPSPLVRVHAVRVAAERADWSGGTVDLAPLVAARLDDPDPLVRRVTADALGRHPAPSNVARLLALIESVPAEDSHLLHTARIALRDHLATPGMYAPALGELWLRPRYLATLADVSLGVAASEAARFTLWLVSRRESPPRLEEFFRHAARHIDHPGLAAVYAAAQRYSTAEQRVQLGVLKAVQRGAQERGAALPPEILAWADLLASRLLATDDESQARDGIELCRDLRLRSAQASVAQLARRDARFDGLRTAAMSACAALDRDQAVPILAGIVADAADLLPARQHAAAELGNINSDASRQALVAALATAPEQLGQPIALALAAHRSGAEQLLAAVAAGKAAGRLLQEPQVRQRLERHGDPELAGRLEQLTVGLPPVDDGIAALLTSRREKFAVAATDAAAGREVFKKHCAACHRVGGEGAKIGPELDGVGIRGLERILEDVLDPSRNVDQAFRSTLLATSDGRSLVGLVLREEGQVLVLADQQGREIRLPLAEIEQREISTLSPMPANVADLVPESDFFDLVAFLLAQRANEN